MTETVSNSLVVKVPYSGTWPDIQPFRLRIAERPGSVPAAAVDARPEDYDETFTDTGQPKWDATARVLTVFLGKGQTARIRYSSYPDLADVLVSQTPAAVPQLGYLHWWIRPIPGRPPFTQQQVLDLAKFAANGVNWQISPFRELALVHAVQQPLFAPTFVAQNPPVQAVLGNTTVMLAFTALFNALTTGKLDLFATWIEPIDDSEDGPKRISGHAHVAELRLEPPLTTTSGDANSKSHSQPHLFGDTKFRSVDYFLRATTAFREYFPAEITADPKNISRDGPKVIVKVPNRARPAAPKALYVLPSFGWDPPRPRRPLAPGAKLSSRRLGGGLRVYLDRPWFSSGDSELLGVVLLPAGLSYGEDNPMKNVVTTWGREVIFQTAAPPDSKRTVQWLRDEVVWVGPGPAAENFRGYRQSGTALRLDEEPWDANAETRFGKIGYLTAWTHVDVVGYEVEYDAQRKLWYADIQIDPGASYCPFIRLALARYQPNSVSGAELSRVVLCDFSQLLPDRTLNIAASADGKMLQVDVAGFAPYGKDSTKEPNQDGRTNIEVTVAMKDPGNPDPDIGWLPLPHNTTVRVRGRTLAPSQAESTAGPPTLWSGTITMPEPIGSGNSRLVVTEVEYLGTPRIVYADTIDM